MVIHYPNGKTFRPQNMPTQKIKASPSKVNYGNRGMTLEEEINDSNQYYRATQKAVIHKKPIPLQIVKVDYPKRSAAVIKEAYFKRPSTTDYNGVYRGYYLDFEAKETRNLASFPLSNFHPHQIEHMRACQKQGGICFTIVRFSKSQEVFLMPADLLFTYWDQQTTGRKSIPKNEISQVGWKIDYRIKPRLPYLDYVDQLIEVSKRHL